MKIENKSSRRDPKLNSEQKEKIEKIRSRFELFEKKLPMRKLTINEWEQLISNTSIGSQTLKIDDLLASLQVLKGSDFWTDDSILAQDGVFIKILKEYKDL